MKKKKSNKEISKKVYPKQNRKAAKQSIFEKYSTLIGLSIIMLLGIVIYSNSFKCSFNFDDLNSIINNTNIQDLSNVKAWWSFSPNRPVSMFTFALNYHFSQLDVWSYHLINLMVHLINACLVWWLTILIISSPIMKTHPLANHKKTLAFFASLFFVSHPLATQSVTYIIQRQASMAAMFYMLSVALYAKARLSEKGSRKKIIFFAGALISGVMAVLTKENAYTLPFAILLFDFCFLRTKRKSVNLKDYRIILVIAAFIGLIVFLFFKFSLHIFDPLPPSQGNDFTVTPLNYLLTQFSVIVKYIQLLILPINQNLDYDFPLSTGFFEIRTLLSFMFLSGLVILAVFLFKRNRIISFGIFWFFLTLIIESSIIPINDLIYEHRTYLPSFGYFIILSTIIITFIWDKNKYVAIALFAIILLSNSILTFERNKVWKNDLTLWSDVVSKSPNKARPVNNRGIYYLKTKQWEKAIADFSKGIELYPKWAVTYYNRGVAREILRQTDKALADYNKAIELDTLYADAYYNRGNVLGNTGNIEQAIENFSKVIQINPDNINALYNRGVSYAALTQWEKAIDDLSRVIEIDPYHAKAFSNLGAAWANTGQWEKAIYDYTRALEIDPSLTATYNNRGIAYMNIGKYAEALADYNKAIEIEPNYTDAYNNREILRQKINAANKDEITKNNTN